jgi:Domain of unknown function (DUF4365)
MLTIPHQKELHSRAYITAVVGHARQNISWDQEFDYKVDGTIKQLEKRGNKISPTSFVVDFQVKSTVNWEHDGDYVVYDLDADSYNYLTERRQKEIFPCILLLLCLNKSDSNWLEITEDELKLRSCLY